MSDLSIVIRCCNEEQHIGRLLTGIMQQTFRDVEIIIVDSGSTDATLSMASRYPVKIVSIRPENFSFGHSLNIGCQTAKGEFVVIASAHVYPMFNDWLEKLLIPLADSDVALAYGKQRGNETTRYSEHQIFERWFPDESDPHQSHPFCNNANAAIRRSLWEKVPYNENLTGLEDLDWAQRVTELGYKIAYMAEAEIIHVHNESPARIYNRYRREAIALKQICSHENFNLSDFFRLSTANIISDCFHACRNRILFRNFRDIFMFRLMQFWGTYRGFSQYGPVSSQLKKKFYYPNSLSRSPKLNDEDKKKRCIDYSDSAGVQSCSAIKFMPFKRENK